MTQHYSGFRPFEHINPRGRFPALLVCDHAVNTVPEELCDLGLDASELDRHIAWDPGARAVTLELAARLDAPALLAGYSRLVIDPNRSPNSDAAILDTSDGTIIPGNVGLDRDERSVRITSCFRPYHDAIDATLDQMGARCSALLCIHSFTPALLAGDGISRPWHASILWGGRQKQFADRIRAALRRVTGLNIGDNEPYAQTPEFGYTAEAHGEVRGLPNLLIEIRQDLLEGENAARDWANHLAEVLVAELATV